MLWSLKTRQADKDCDRAIVKIAEGDKDALSVIYNSYGKLITAAAYQITHNYHTAEDVLQDVMVAIAEKAAQYKSGTNPRAWVMAVTRNIAINRQNLHDNSKSLPLDTAVISIADSVDSSLLIEDALSVLSPEDRFLVYGRLYVGLNHSQLGQALGISRKASSARYNRALAKLKAYFEER